MTPHREPEAGILTSPRGPGERAAGGFTLLELIIAVTMLAVFLLPMMLIVAKAKNRAIQYTIEREVRDLAQRKLFDRIHYYEVADRGDFSQEGRTAWTWEILPPEPVGGGEQVLLQYTIEVSLPQKINAGSGAGAGAGLAASSAHGQGEGVGEGEGSIYQMSLWTFPDARWYEEQAILYESGQPSQLYGSPLTGGMTGGTY
ncbi:MAG TPA: prepilin-type N-terminal cleavage/methylation domain-containing protein [Planctomycetota bacterium]|nr:prepilin-type N-terminal cleavage/methylation domain-containing protein [Planctomycetota bacterium]